MLKKLARYGNSLALVLDKPILELLNIKDDTILKIKTDGTSIIITPQETTQKTDKISASSTEVMMSAGQEMKEMVMQGLQTPEAQEAMKNMDTYMRMFAEVHKKYAHVQHAMLAIQHNQNYIHDLEELDQQKLRNTITAQDYLFSVAELAKKYVPELENYQNEIKTITEKIAQNQIKISQQKL